MEVNSLNGVGRCQWFTKQRHKLGYKMKDIKFEIVTLLIVLVWSRDEVDKCKSWAAVAV